MPSYKDLETAGTYLEFINSPDGKIQKDILWSFFLPHFPKNENIAILDAGCGSGWLVRALSERYAQISGCDISPKLIAAAKENFTQGNFMVADICKEQPFQHQSFDVVILNMVVHDLEDQKNAFFNVQKCLKPKGLMLVTIINPYYAFPVGKWKRGLIRLLLRKKPRLVLETYNSFMEQPRQFIWKKNIPGYFYTLSETINNALAANFNLLSLEEVISNKDSQNFDLNYRLHRFPIILLLKFVKTGE